MWFSPLIRIMNNKKYIKLSMTSRRRRRKEQGRTTENLKRTPGKRERLGRTTGRMRAQRYVCTVQRVG